jgi:hypothetical protein
MLVPPALAVPDRSPDGVAHGFERERRPGLADATAPDFVIRREAQLLIDYGDSPIVGRSDDPDWHLVAAPDADPGNTVVPVLRDTAGEFVAAYSPVPRR